MNDDEQPVENDEKPVFPVGQMVATGHAEIIRNGKVVEDDENDEESR